MLLSLDLSVLYLAQPHLSAELGPSSTQQLWIVDIYGFMIAGFLVTMGTLGGLNQFERHYTRSPSRSSKAASALTSLRCSGNSPCASRGLNLPPELVKLGGR